MLLRPKRQDLTTRKTNTHLYVILGSRNYVKYVHRITYKRLPFDRGIEKSILLLDNFQPPGEVSSFCIRTNLEYKIEVKPFFIIYPTYIIFFVSELFLLQNSRQSSFLSSISLSAGLGVTG